MKCSRIVHLGFEFLLKVPMTLTNHTSLVQEPKNTSSDSSKGRAEFAPPGHQKL